MLKLTNLGPSSRIYFRVKSVYLFFRTYLKLGKYWRKKESQKSRQEFQSKNDYRITGSKFFPEKKKEFLIAGPWMGELGFEILYWAPLINSLFCENLLVISRGGTSSIYPSKSKYLELFEHIDQAHWNKFIGRRQRVLGGEKQRSVLPSEISVIKKILKNENINENRIMHPMQMFAMYNFNSKSELFFQIQLLEKLVEDLEFSKIAGKKQNSIFYDVYQREGLTQESLDAFNQVNLKSLIGQFEVQIIRSSYSDNHQFVSLPRDINENTKVTETIVERKSNLQSKITQIMRSKRVITTNGGMAYLSLLLGTPTIAFQGEASHWNPHHDLLAKKLAQLTKTEYEIISI